MWHPNTPSLLLLKCTNQYNTAHTRHTIGCNIFSSSLSLKFQLYRGGGVNRFLNKFFQYIVQDILWRFPKKIIEEEKFRDTLTVRTSRKTYICGKTSLLKGAWIHPQILTTFRIIKNSHKLKIHFRLVAFFIINNVWKLIFDNFEWFHSVGALSSQGRFSHREKCWFYHFLFIYKHLQPHWWPFRVFGKYLNCTAITYKENFRF